MTTLMSDDVAQTIADLAARQHCTVTAILRSAVSTETWRQDVLANYGDILVEQSSGRVRLVHFPY